MAPKRWRNAVGLWSKGRRSEVADRADDGVEPGLITGAARRDRQYSGGAKGRYSGQFFIPKFLEKPVS